MPFQFISSLCIASMLFSQGLCISNLLRLESKDVSKYQPPDVLANFFKKSNAMRNMTDAEQSRFVSDVLQKDWTIRKSGETKNIKAMDLINNVTITLEKILETSELEVQIKDIQIIGGAATYALDKSYKFNDLDVQFVLDYAVEDRIAVSTLIEQAVREYLNISKKHLMDALEKKVIVPLAKETAKESDSIFSLFSFKPDPSLPGQNIELKFAKMRKEGVSYAFEQFEFTTSSFKASLKNYYGGGNIQVQSSYEHGIYKAERALKNRTAICPNPQLVRGGAFLKGCALQQKGFNLEFGNGFSVDDCILKFFDDATIKNPPIKQVNAHAKNHYPDQEEGKAGFLKNVVQYLQNFQDQTLDNDLKEKARLLVLEIQKSFALQNSSQNILKK